MPTISEVNELAKGLYNDPSLRPILRDMLEECDPPTHWNTWLEQSGTLQRLAECMVYMADRLSYNPREEFHYWRGQVGYHLTASKRPENYIALCDAFGVPPMMIEIGVRRLNTQVFFPHYDAWEAPSVQLALDTLRTSLDHIAYVPGSGEVCGVNIPWEALDRHVHETSTQFVSYRLKHGASQWAERRLLPAINPAIYQLPVRVAGSDRDHIDAQLFAWSSQAADARARDREEWMSRQLGLSYGQARALVERIGYLTGTERERAQDAILRALEAGSPLPPAEVRRRLGLPEV